MTKGRILRDVSLAPRTTFEVGGKAAFFVEATSEAMVCDALAWAHARGVAAFVLGGGSNLLVGDRGFSGLVVRMAISGLTFEDVRARVGAGETLDAVIERSVAEGRPGLECLSGIPGTIGATPLQNVGAYGQQIADTLALVRAIDKTTLEPVSFDRGACHFAYRKSAFKDDLADRFVITSLELDLPPSRAPTVRYPDLERDLAERGIARPTLMDVRQTVLAVRRSKSMVVDPDDPNRRSAGSFFVNPVVSGERADEIAARAPGMPRYPAEGGVKLSAAWLIEQAGFPKGTSDGAVGLSTRHALAIVNRGGATAIEILKFAARVRAAVQGTFGVLLRHEPTLLGFEDCDLEAAGFAVR